MKIAHIVRQFYPSVGGLEDYVYNLAKEQIADGHQVSIITLNSDFQTDETLKTQEVHHDLQITRVPWKGSRRYSLCWIPTKLLNSHDVVHVHAVDYFIDYLSMMKRFGLLKAKLILSTHGGFFHTNNNRKLKELWFKTITKFTLSKADAVVSNSSNDQKLFAQIAPSVTQINNAIRVRKFGGPTDVVPNNDMVYLGRFSSNKRLLWLIRAFSKLQNPPGTLKIIGQSKTGDTPALQALIAELNCSASVQLLLDLSVEEIAAHITSSKFTVSASEYEGFGLSTVELMSYGLVPFLAEEPLTFNNFVEESGAGKIFSVVNDNFATQYKTLIDEWSAAQAHSVAEYAKTFSWQATASEMTNVYKSTFTDGLRAY